VVGCPEAKKEASEKQLKGKTQPCPYCKNPIPDSGVFGLPTYTDVPENHKEGCPIKIVITTMLILTLLGVQVQADTKDCDRWVNRWNWQEKEWTYTSPCYELKWDWHNKKWVFAPPKSDYKFNQRSKKWEVVPKQ
jgi:hypothetical protein